MEIGICSSNAQTLFFQSIHNHSKEQHLGIKGVWSSWFRTLDVINIFLVVRFPIEICTFAIRSHHELKQMEI
jgi:hypothetical protein